jgi:prolyl-tRNA synthetase
MVHGDDQGLIMPPRLAPYQAVIVPIFRNDDERSHVMENIGSIQSQLADLRVKLDDRDGLTPGYKFYDWELRGVPLRIELGPKDVAEGTVTLARRDQPGRKGKSVVKQEGLVNVVEDLLDDIHNSIFHRAQAFLDENTHQPEDYEGFIQVVKSGWADAWWCGDSECEAEIKEETKATLRCIPLDQPGGEGTCIHCGQYASERAIFARAY